MERVGKDWGILGNLKAIYGIGGSSSHSYGLSHNDFETEGLNPNESCFGRVSKGLGNHTEDT